MTSAEVDVDMGLVAQAGGPPPFRRPALVEDASWLVGLLGERFVGTWRWRSAAGQGLNAIGALLHAPNVWRSAVYLDKDDRQRLLVQIHDVDSRCGRASLSVACSAATAALSDVQSMVAEQLEESVRHFPLAKVNVAVAGFDLAALTRMLSPCRTEVVFPRYIHPGTRAEDDLVVLATDVNGPTSVPSG